MERAVDVVADGGAVTRRRARHRGKLDEWVFAGVRGQQGLDAGSPPARPLGQQQPLFVARPVGVAADGGAVTRRRARHRADARVRVFAGVRGQRGLDAGRPPARPLGQQQPLEVARAVGVAADGGAVPRRRARYVTDGGVPVRAGVCGQRRLDAGRRVRCCQRLRRRRSQHQQHATGKRRQAAHHADAMRTATSPRTGLRARTHASCQTQHTRTAPTVQQGSLTHQPLRGASYDAHKRQPATRHPVTVSGAPARVVTCGVV